MSPELAALAIHDLKNELGSLEGQLVALEAEPSAEAARSARRLCGRLRRDAVAFLTLYRGEELRAVVDDASPRVLLEALVRHADAGSSGVHVTLADVDAAPPFWYFDPLLVRLALDAALHNACRFARSLVTVSARERDGSLVLRVDDDGPGLAATTRGDAADGAGAWSTGLGTELCRAVARAHSSRGQRGRVELSNRSDDASDPGARFELVLP